ncbi:hypothetical protein D3C86_1701800 [compost metagenome]
MVRQPGFSNLVADANHRIERVFRVLHDHRDALAANAAHLRLADRTQIYIAKLHLCGADPRLRRMQTQQRAPDGGFPGAGLADNRQLLTPELEGDAAYGVGHRAAVDKIDVQIAHIEQWSVIRCEDRGCHVGHLLRS